jgi:CRP-like cAMP-binding protein
MFENIKKYYYTMIPHLTDDEWNAMQQCIQIKEFSKGDHMVKQGEICNYVYFINAGFSRFYQMINGKEISTGFTGENEFVSAYDSFLTRQPAVENLDALENTQTFCLSYQNIQTLYIEYPVYQIFGRKIAEKLFIWINQRNNALLLLSPEQRYTSMIENNSKLPQRIPQYMLASYIGVTPEHLSRIRKKMMTK